MSLNDRQRLQEDLCQPRIVQLHLALQRLRSCISFMNSGAHPDDECSAMLAALSLRDGVDVSYICANRGEGGQNDLGTESGATLGTLRTAEMEKAAGALDMRLYWLSTHPQDAIHDFGFSKSGEQTLDHWGRERTLHRFVSIVRNEQPDILCPTFLDVPGQHGHHRAMTSMAFEVMERAADPDYRTVLEHTNAVDSPWQISKLYLPAWGGGGSAYDDEEPPPAETLCINASSSDSVTGWSYANLGQQSRRHHLSQGMGRWVMQGTEHNWPLHLARSYLDKHPAGTVESNLNEALAHNFSLWAQRIDDKTLAGLLVQVHAQLEATIHAFPDFERVTDNAFKAVQAIDRADVHLNNSVNTIKPTDSSPLSNRALCRKLSTKRLQLGRVIMITSGVKVRAWADRTFWHPGDIGQLTFDNRDPLIPDVQSHARIVVATDNLHSTPWHIDGEQMVLDKNAQPSNPYPAAWDPLQPDGPVIEVRLQYGSSSSSSSSSSSDDEATTAIVHLPLETPPIILSSNSARLQPLSAVLNLSQPSRALDVSVSHCVPDSSKASFSLPEKWTQQSNNGRFTVQANDDVQVGLYKLPLELDGKATSLEHIVSHAHIKPRVICTPAAVQVQAMNVSLPDVRVGYIGGGNDRVAMWLRNIGLPLSEIDDASLSDAQTLEQTLSAIDTLVIGVFAYRMRKSLASMAVTINQWVHEGGHLLTLYHRPWDNWDPARTPPSHLEIGQPSLRYRVTDENADVTHLQPSHKLLNTPNVIGLEDWHGWHKERGLYFAKSWSDQYTPLLSMSDPGEQPHSGALLCADIGQGQHVHTSLILHHQMEHLVPGAFRLMANLVS